MRLPRSLVVLGLAVLALPNVVSAQARVEVTAFAGAAVFASDLTDVFGGDQIVQSLDNAIAFGAHVGARFSSFSIEGTAAIVPTDLISESAALGVAPSVSQTVLMLGVDVLYDLGGEAFEPFLAAGVGIKSYSADDPLSPPGFESGIDPAFNIGVGGRLWITESAAIRIDLRDYISTFDAFDLIPDSGEDAKLQNDLLLTVGISFTSGG